LLDTWREWPDRCTFESEVATVTQSTDFLIKSVYLTCTYCGKSVSKYTDGVPANAEALHAEAMRKKNVNRAATVTATGGGKAAPPLSTSCPACRKPLPRCSVCGRTVGVEAGQRVVEAEGGGVKRKAKRHVKEDPNAVLTKFDDFPSWCQKCRHGGHAGCLFAWFDDNVRLVNVEA